MKTLVGLFLVATSITAQTLSISPAGEIRLSPAPERTAELYASSSPRGGQWQFVQEFAQSARVPTNETKFYRARVKREPLKLIAITATNQTIRGSVDKQLTNLLLIVNGATNQGWGYGEKNRLPQPGEGRMPITTQVDFCFRRLEITNTTPCLLMLWDDDGYLLATNLFIGPGPFVPLAPKFPRDGIKYRPSPLAPASGAGAEYAPTTSWWAIFSHSSSESASGIIATNGPCHGKKNSLHFSGSWDGEFSSLAVGSMGCREGRDYDCSATYDGPGRRMTLAMADGCDYPEAITYSVWPEVGSWNEDSDTDSGKFSHGASTSAKFWLGGELRGPSESNYWVRIYVYLEQAIERIGGGTELLWNTVPAYNASALGTRPTSDGTIYVQVPPEGVLVTVTPSTGHLGQGWFSYGFAAAIE